MAEFLYWLWQFVLWPNFYIGFGNLYYGRIFMVTGGRD